MADNITLKIQQSESNQIKELIVSKEPSKYSYLFEFDTPLLDNNIKTYTEVADEVKYEFGIKSVMSTIYLDIENDPIAGLEKQYINIDYSIQITGSGANGVYVIKHLNNSSFTLVVTGDSSFVGKEFTLVFTQDESRKTFSKTFIFVVNNDEGKPVSPEQFRCNGTTYEQLYTFEDKEYWKLIDENQSCKEDWVNTGEIKCSTDANIYKP